MKGGKMLGKIFKFIGVGVAATLIDYAVYSLVVMVIFGGNTNFAWAGAVSSGVVATFAAFFMHSKITWKDKDPGKYGIIKFFAWNAFVVIAIRPVLTLFFGLLIGLYQFAFMIFDGVGVGFSYEFVESTGIYVLMTAVTMTLNFIFYDKIVFGKKKVAAKSMVDSNLGNEEQREKIDMKSVRKTGEEKQRQSKGNNNSDKKRK